MMMMLSTLVGDHGKSVWGLIVLDQAITFQDGGLDRNDAIAVVVVWRPYRFFQDCVQQWLQLQCVVEINCIDCGGVIHGHVERNVGVGG